MTKVYMADTSSFGESGSTELEFPFGRIYNPAKSWVIFEEEVEE